ncbi:hypothetical protein CDD81_7192 [Ophiocordyceps australis]|uniref:ATP-dependent RNA helicase n=1 Tax=Ophiocordyceps australis TaxID=1399860 RepID=A0A2C5Y3Y9_9HYPO|nr:hypothetical protein CDD81_7192 [Ophiocordyceps australis]
MASLPKKREKKTPKPSRTELRQQKRKREVEDVESLETAIAALDPKTSPVTSFADLPLSQQTLAGLRASHFQTLTDVQQHAIPLALKSRDVLAAAKTGSGKTLAFLVPVLERLYRARWTEYDGLGALIISPTRELAVQTFEVLRKIGRSHVFSAGLVIGGKSLSEEAERIARMNILVCTPGRMLQHLDQTAGLDIDNLQMLVMDEADRIMDLGFQADVDALVNHLPAHRQTLLFSATQSKKVSDLARLSLKDPEYVSVHEAASSATPTSLQQHYIITPLPEKLDTLYGFLKSNLKSKILVFLSSGKQVRFVYESFRHMQPGIPLLHLHGRQKQGARLEITSRFTSAKHSCLIATDVVARGIDFPAVDWVIQVDCPEDVDTYIHRVGRTARYQSKGRAVLFMDPSEEDGMLKRLEHKKIPIQRVNVKQAKKRSIKEQLQSLCFKFPDLKYLGQKAFISYSRAIYLQKDKQVFRFDELDLDAFAASMGLAGTPQIRFQKGEDAKKLKNAPRRAMSSGSESEMDLDGPYDSQPKKEKKKEVRTKYDKMFERQNQDVLSSHYTKLIQGGTGDFQDAAAETLNDGDDFLAVKRHIAPDDAAIETLPNGVKVLHGLGGKDAYVIDSKRREKALKSKKKMLKFKGGASKLVFDDEGVPHPAYELQHKADFDKLGDAHELHQKFIADESRRVREADRDDAQRIRDRKREKREKQRAAERGLGGDDFASAPRLVAAGGEDEDALALMRELPVAGAAADDDDDKERPRKRTKKWFQDGTDAMIAAKSRPANKVLRVTEQPETLQDFETLAMGLLDN